MNDRTPAKHVAAVVVTPPMAAGSSAASPDAEMMCTTLKACYPPINIYPLSTDATIPAIGRAVLWLRQQAADLKLFYFSGHGSRDGVDSYMVTVDSEPANIGYSLSTLVRQLSAPSDSQHDWLAILDCCHPDTTGLHGGLHRSDIDSALSYPGSNRAMLVACEPHEQSVAIVGHSSPFSAEVVGGLRGSASNSRGQVTLGSLYDFVCQRLADAHLPGPKLAGDLASSFALRTGLPPRGTPGLGAISLETVINDAARFASDLHATSMVPDNEWRESGWLASTRRIEPVLRWFRREATAHPELHNDQRFTQSFQTVQRVLANVSNIGTGMKTEAGTIEHRLGEGGFGTVWVARDAMQRQVALKVYHANQLYNAEKLGRFERGYRAMKRLSHKQIVEVYSYSSVPPAISMQLIDGVDLEKTQLAMDFSTRQHLILSICNALAYAHSEGVVHRDIKPANIVLRNTDGDLLPVLTDFDLAWYATATEVTRDGLGAPYYAAPEQNSELDTAQGRDPRVDVYAMGQLLFYVMTGHNPHHVTIEKNADALERSLRSELSCSYRTASSMVDVYLHATSSRQADRFDSINDLTRAIRSIQFSTADNVGSPLTFRVFAYKMFGRARMSSILIDNAGKATAVSQTGRSTLEMISRTSTSGAANLQIRFRFFDLPGQRTAPGQWERRLRARNAAAARSDPELTFPIFGRNIPLAQLALEEYPLHTDHVEQLARRIQTVISAAEREQSAQGARGPKRKR